MPFDSYSGTISQYVDRIVNLLTTMTNTPFSLVATYGTTYKWYALQYTDPDGYTQNNVYIIIGPHSMRAAQGHGIRVWPPCTTTGYNYGRPVNYHGFSVIISTAFDTTNFAIPSTASVYWTFFIRSYETVSTSAIGATACNDTNVAYRYLDELSTFYTWYDKYGFVFMQIPQSTPRMDAAFFGHVYRLTPYNTSITRPWWVLLNDQQVFQFRNDTYYTVSTRIPPYPVPGCGRNTYTTSATATSGICMDNPTALNIPSGIASYMTSTSTYPATVATSFTQTARTCAYYNTLQNPGVRSLYVDMVRVFMDPTVAPARFLPYGECIYIPTTYSNVDGYVYAFYPVVNVARTMTWNLRGIFAPITTFFPIAYGDPGIAPGDVIQTSAGQYVVLQVSNMETTTVTGETLRFNSCINDVETTNLDIMIYALRYA